MSFRFPQPSNEDDFELFCLRFLRELWKCQTLQQYGKRGERQHGIDLIDESARQPLRCVQCKHHESDKTIPPAEIVAEVNKVLGAPFPVGEYYILTTARKTTQAQNAIVRINCEQDTDGSFKLFLWTWTDIETRLSELDDLAQDRVLRGDTGRSAPAISRMMSAVLTEYLDRPLYSSGNVLDLELQRVHDAIERHELEFAESNLVDVEKRAADKLQPHQWYQLKALRFRILAACWKWDKAGLELLDAKRHMPNTERARVNEALGYELLGQRDKSHQIATELRREFPYNIRLLTIWIRTSPPDTPFISLVDAASVRSNVDAELFLALAHRARLENRIADFVAYAQRAVALDGGSPQSHLTLGEAKHLEGHSGPIGFHAAPLREAEQQYDRAVQLAREQKMTGLEALARFSRGQVRHLLGDSRAQFDFAAAVELAQPDQHLRIMYASYLLEMGRPNDALRELQMDSGEPSSDRLYYEAAALYERNAGGDRDNALSLLRHVIRLGPAERWDDAHILLVQSAIGTKFATEVYDAIHQSSLRTSNPLVFYTLIGWLSASRGENEAARAAYKMGVEATTLHASRQHLFLLAQALISIGEDDQALPLLLRCYRTGQFDTECRKLLDTARRLNHHDISSRVCRELREAGETDARIVLTEINILQLYDPQKALRVAQEYLDKHPDNCHVTLLQSALALRLGHDNLIVSELQRLPTPEEITAEMSGVVINILCAVERSTEALRYSYRTLRTHFDQEVAHAQYLASILRLSPNLEAIVTADTVGPGTAVCYRESHRDIDQWVVLEDEEEPELALNEVGSNHALSKVFSGHRIGEIVTLPGSDVQPRQATIRDIVHKYVYRFRDCSQLFQERFPGGTACQLIHVGSGEDLDLNPILRNLEGRRRLIDALDELFQTKGMPIYVYAQLSGVDEMKAWTHLTAHPDLGIRCAGNQRDQMDVGKRLAAASSTVVIDSTAILTLAHVDLLHALRGGKRAFIVSQNTFEWLQHLVDDATGRRSEEGGVLFANEGQLEAREVTSEQRDCNRRFLTSIRDAVREYCQIRPCLSAADLSPKRRDTIIEAVGRRNLESMLLACEPNTVLWTDDLIIGILGQTEFQSPRVWSQVMLRALCWDGAIAQPEYEEAIAKLVGWHYHGTLWDAETLVAAGRIAKWQRKQWPFSHVLRGLASNGSDSMERIRIAAAAIRRVCNMEWNPLRNQHFLVAILRNLKSIESIRQLQQMIPLVFPHNAHIASEVTDCISEWLRKVPSER